MTEAQAIELLSQHWKAQWATLHAESEADPTHVPYALENEQYRGTTARWALVFFRHGVSRQLTHGPAGARKFERRGQVLVFLFGAVDVGRAPLSALVGDVRTVLEAQRITGAAGSIYTEAAASAEAGVNGQTTDGAWFTQRVTVPFRYVELA